MCLNGLPLLGCARCSTWAPRVLSSGSANALYSSARIALSRLARCVATAASLAAAAASAADCFAAASPTYASVRGRLAGPVASGGCASPTSCSVPASAPRPCRPALAKACTGAVGPCSSLPKPVPGVQPALRSSVCPTDPWLKSGWLCAALRCSRVRGPAWASVSSPAPAPPGTNTGPRLAACAARARAELSIGLHHRLGGGATRVSSFRPRWFRTRHALRRSRCPASRVCVREASRSRTPGEALWSCRNAATAPGAAGGAHAGHAGHVAGHVQDGAAEAAVRLLFPATRRRCCGHPLTARTASLSPPASCALAKAKAVHMAEEAATKPPPAPDPDSPEAIAAAKAAAERAARVAEVNSKNKAQEEAYKTALRAWEEETAAARAAERERLLKELVRPCARCCSSWCKGLTRWFFRDTPASLCMCRRHAGRSARLSRRGWRRS